MKRYHDDWAVMILVIDASNKRTVLVRENDYNTWKFPCGCKEDGEDPEDTARRELKEETGLVATELCWLYTEDRGDHDMILYAAHVKSFADRIPFIEEEDGTTLETGEFDVNSIGAGELCFFESHKRTLRKAGLLTE